MTVNISIKDMPEARARLAAMSQGEVEDVALRGLADAAVFCVVASELELAIAEAGDFLRNGDHDLAQGRLDEALAALEKALPPVPTPGNAP